MSLRVLFYVPQLGVGGTELHVLALARRLAGDGFGCAVWRSGPSGPVEGLLNKAGIETFYGPLGARPAAWLGMGALVRGFRERDFDILHSYGYGPHYLDALVAKWAGIPVYISSRRNVRHWEGGDRLGLAERLRNRLSDAVVANCEAVKRRAVEVEGLDPEGVTVILNGVDLDGIPRGFDRGASRAALGCPPDALVLGCLGSLKPVKGQLSLVRAFAAASRREPRLRLVLCGEGPDKDRLLEACRELGVADRVAFTRTVEGRFALLKSLDVFVLPSLHEGFPNALLEAMACGVPVVARRTGGVPEAVEEGRTGFLFDDDDGLERALGPLLRDPSLRERMGAAAEDRARREFGLDAMAGSYAELYRGLARAKGLR